MDRAVVEDSLTAELRGRAVPGAAGGSGVRWLERTAIDAEPGEEWTHAWSGAVDTALAEHVERLDRPGGVAVVALGSYARRALCPGSDLDVLLLHDGWRTGDLESLVRSVFYPLWDAGLSVGHQVATPREAVRAAGDHLDSATALIERRLVAGDPGLVDDLAGRTNRFIARRKASLLADLTRANAARHDRDGPEPGMLEPDLKSGAGGLRDLHSLRWAAAALLGEPTLGALVGAGYLAAAEVGELHAAQARLLRVRVALHQELDATRPARGIDRLRLDLHDDVAARLGERSGDDLLRTTGLAMRVVRHVHGRAWPQLVSDARRGRRRRRGGDGTMLERGVVLRADVVETTPGATLHADASLPLRVLAAAGQRGLHVGRATTSTLARELAAVGSLEWTGASRSALLALLRCGERALPAWSDADHMGVWEVLLPGWSQVRGWPQRNPYHRYDLDTHLIRSLVELVRIAEGGIDERTEAVAARLTAPEVLLLATFLHDVGKPWPGDHSEQGSVRTAAWVRHMGFGSRRADAVAHLVRHHLLLPDAATSRDLDDPAEIAKLADLVADPESLDQLLLLSLADSRATGPSAWSPWKDNLLAEAHERVRLHLLGGQAAWARTTGPAVVERDASRVVGGDAVAQLLDGLPRGYLLAADVEQVVAHARQDPRADDAGAARDGVRPRAQWREGPATGTAVISFVAADRRGLVADCAGLLAASGATVLDARAFTRTDGVAFDWFVIGRDDRVTGEPLDLDRVVAELRRLDDGSLDVAGRLGRRERRRDERLPEPLPPVEVDVVRGPRRWRIEVRAPDAPGMLCRLARVLADDELDIDGARVTTLTGEVRDVFLLRVGDDGADPELDGITARLEAAVADAVAATGRRPRSSA